MKTINNIIQKPYLYLEKNYDDIYDKLRTKTQKNRFREIYLQAYDTFWAKIKDTLSDNNSVVKSITKELKKTMKSIEDDINTLNANEFLDLATKAITEAAAIVRLADEDA